MFELNNQKTVIQSIKRGMYPVYLGKANYDLPATVDIKQRITRAISQQLPSFLLKEVVK